MTFPEVSLLNFLTAVTHWEIQNDSCLGSTHGLPRPELSHRSVLPRLRIPFKEEDCHRCSCTCRFNLHPWWVFFPLDSMLKHGFSLGKALELVGISMGRGESWFTKETKNELSQWTRGKRILEGMIVCTNSDNLRTNRRNKEDSWLLFPSSSYSFELGHWKYKATFTATIIAVKGSRNKCTSLKENCTRNMWRNNQGLRVFDDSFKPILCETVPFPGSHF